jgi:U3 small nucleolar RNA-associated protein 25
MRTIQVSQREWRSPTCSSGYKATLFLLVRATRVVHNEVCATRDFEACDCIVKSLHVLESLSHAVLTSAHTLKPIMLADAPDAEMDAVLLHALNHVLQTADRIKKNNERAAAANVDPDSLPRDQGFTRPKVLFLLPMRSMACKVVLRLLTLALRETRTDTIQRKEKFLEEFDEDDDEEEENDERAKKALARKPAEHRALFHGNLDDHFRLGIKLTRGAARLYADFYQSDILVCSPLGLATKLAEKPPEGASQSINIDFLSSIEILVIDRADVILMQNWAHLKTVVAALNNLPAEQREVDIMRVREWYLAGQARHYRQTVMMSSFVSPEMTAFMARDCSNYAGVIRLQPSYRGVLGRVVPQIRHIFERIPVLQSSSSSSVPGPATDADARFEYFRKSLWPRVREAAHGGGQLIYVPSYFDYVRVRNFLRAENASFLGLCEYTDRGDMARARSYFADGRRRVLLYTERAQFYNRHRIRGLKDILFYQLPEHPQFYLELVNWLDEEGGNGAAAGMATVTVAFSKFDMLRLERVVGTERAALMTKKAKHKGRSTSERTGTFMFC